MPRGPAKPKRRSPGRGSVTVRTDGRICVVLPTDLDPKRKPIYSPGKRQPFASREAAEAWLDAEIAARRSPTRRSATLREPLGAYLARWYRLYCASRPERTAKAYLRHLRRWIILADVPLGDLTREVVQAAVVELRAATWRHRKPDGTLVGPEHPYSPRTIQQARSVLHQALDVLVPDVLPANPVRSDRERLPDVAQPVWDADQVARFLDVAERTEPHLALAFRLILRRALRRGEVLDLRWSDVNERAGTLTIDETAGDRLGQSGPTKTRRIRDVPLSADLIQRLRAYRRAYPSTSPHIFHVHGHRVSFSEFRLAWLRAVRVAGLPAINPRDGRATCATILLDEGRPLPEVSRLLGHANIATTARFYARIVQRRVDQTIQLGEDFDSALDRAAERAAESAPASILGA